MVKIPQDILNSLTNLGVENLDFHVAIRKDSIDIALYIFDTPNMAIDLIEDFIKTSFKWYQYKGLISSGKLTKKDEDSYLIHLKR